MMKNRKPMQRKGTSVTEVIVAATLLLSMIGLVVPTSIRAAHIIRDARHYQAAMNELSNQFEYLSALSEAERAVALTQLQVSEVASRSLADAKLGAAIATEKDGVRMTLSLNWDRGAEAKPVQLIGWLKAAVEGAPNTGGENNSQKEESNETT